jgi:hypothetical protein
MHRILITSILFAVCLFGTAQNSFFNIMDYGAVNDGKTINTKSIQKAIDDCAGKGGGTVYFPAGRYISGTLFLKSFVTLHLETGAVLEGSKNLIDYPVTESRIRSYTDNYTNKSLIYGEDLQYITITGQGIIDGNGASFKASDEQRKTNVFDSYKIRPYLIRIINCENVTVKEITIINSPMWVQHYLLCRNVDIDGISVNSRVNNNNDGIDIDACENVRISNCNIISGDDAIVIKSTLDKPCRNVTITNCTLSSNCNAFKLGTESSGDFNNISLSNCIIYDNRLAGIALEMVDGGSLNNVSVTDVNMDKVGCAIFIRLGNRARPFLENNPSAYTNRQAAKNDLPKPGMGSMYNVIISNIQGTNIGKTGCSITSIPSFPARNITLSNIRLGFTGGGTKDLVNRIIEEFPDKYPEFGMFGTLPAYGFFCRHVTGLALDNIDLSYQEPDYRPALFLDDVKDSRISDLNAYCEEETESVIIIENSKNILIRDCYSPKKSGVPATIRNASSGITIINNKRNASDINQSEGLVNRKVDCTPQICDDREIRITKPGDIVNKRLEIIRAIWNDSRIPGRSDVIVTSGIPSPLHPNEFVGRVDRIEIPVEGLDSLKDLAYLFVPVRRNKRLIVFNPGHSCTLIDDESHHSRIEATITGLVEAGYDVLSVYMPHVKESSDPKCRFDHCQVFNTDLGIPDPLPTYGLRLFLDPTIVSLNYVMNKYKYKRVDMVGLSGGGWTTNLISALDDRIRFSFNVAGSIPLFYRIGGSIGDIEQFLPQLYRDIAGYPDLYILGASGKGRKQVQILNRQDNCCFGQKQHDPARDYTSDMHHFAQTIKDRLESLKEKDHYYLIIDETAPNHQISEYALMNVILPELKGK